VYQPSYIDLTNAIINYKKRKQYIYYIHNFGVIFMTLFNHAIPQLVYSFMK